MVGTTGFELATSPTKSAAPSSMPSWRLASPPSHPQGLLVPSPPTAAKATRGRPASTFPSLPTTSSSGWPKPQTSSSPRILATSVIAKSQRIAQNFKNGIAFQRAGNHPDPTAK
jgi:hypothetical protein